MIDCPIICVPYVCIARWGQHIEECIPSRYTHEKHPHNPHSFAITVNSPNRIWHSVCRATWLLLLLLRLPLFWCCNWISIAFLAFLSAVKISRTFCLCIIYWTHENAQRARVVKHVWNGIHISIFGCVPLSFYWFLVCGNSSPHALWMTIGCGYSYHYHSF